MLGLLSAALGIMQGQTLTDYVDPTIGTGDHGHVFIGANVPFGMVQAGPTQYQWEWDWCSGYHASSDSIIGFGQMHLSGTGCSDLGDIALMPVVGDVTCSRLGLVSTYRHETEEARAGYYAVTLDRHDVRAEMTATARVAMYRFTYGTAAGSQAQAEGAQQSLVIDLENAVGLWDRTTQCRIQQTDSCTFVGFRNSRGWAWRQQVCFVITCNRPIREVTCYGGSRKDAQGQQYAVLTWDDSYRREPLLVKVALSPVSEAGAWLNMQTELPGWDFEAVRHDADQRWQQQLARVSATFPTLRETRIFYTALYHLMVAPQLWNDCNGDYLGVNLRPCRNADYDHLTTFSLWDTYRAAHPLFTLLFADRSRDCLRTMLDIFDQSGELPVWHLMSNETYCMVGEPAVPVVADILLKGQQADVDAERAYQAIRTSLLPTDSASQWPEGFGVINRTYDSRGKDQLLQYGYIPYDGGQGETVAKNMEYYLALWSAAQVAGRLGHTADSIMMAQLSHNYRLLYDPSVGFMRARSKDGHFRSTDGFNPCHQTGDYTEGNPWQYTFLVPHDVQGLITLMGGDKAFEQKLDALLEADGDLGAHANPDITGLIGQYAHGNEPSHHILYLYNYINKPAKAQRMIRRVMDELYDDKPAGLCGNEDVGQMSAWYILSALGLYQVEPCGGRYQLGCPAVREAVLNITGTDRKTQTTFVIRTHGDPRKAVVKKWRLNGQPLHHNYIMHSDLTAGGVLEAWY